VRFVRCLATWSAALAVVSGAVSPAGAHRTPLSRNEVRDRASRLPPDLMHEVAGMQYVLTPDELAVLLSDTNAARCRAWIDGWWTKRDPIPTNEANEARDEHEQRVLTAQAAFGRGAWPGWDDRGVVVIRYGTPAVRSQTGADVQQPGVYVPAEELWYYPQFHVYVRFHDTGYNGYAQYQESVQISLDERPRNDRREMASVKLPDLPMDYMDVDIDLTDAMGAYRPLADAGYDRFMRQVHDYYNLVDEMPAVYPFDLPAMHIPAFVAVQRFRGGDGVDRVDVNTEFNSTVRPMNVRSHRRRFVTTSVFWNQAGKVVGRVAHADSIGTGLFASDSLATVINQVTMTLPPGTYRMAVAVQEEGSGRFASAQREIECYNMDNGVAMSDLALARTIDMAKDGSPFNRGPLEVVPQPSGIYRAGAPVPVYFEVYHVGVSDHGGRAYRVEYTIKPRNEPHRSLWSRLFGGSDEPLQVRSGFDAVAPGPDDVVHVSAGTGNLPPGDYVLEVAVTDGATSRRVVRETSFHLLK